MRTAMTPYDMGLKPCRQNTLLLPLIWIASWFMMRNGKLKIGNESEKEWAFEFLHGLKATIKEGNA